MKSVHVGIDLIKNEKGYYLLELNTNAGGFRNYQQAGETNFFVEQLVNTCKRKCFSKLFIIDEDGLAFLNGEFGANLVDCCHKSGITLEILETLSGINKDVIGDDSFIFRIVSEEFRVVDKIARSKKLTQRFFEKFPIEGILLPRIKGFEFHSNPRFPKIVSKEESNYGGMGMEFYNTCDLTGIHADILQEYIMPECSNYGLVKKNGEIRKISFSGTRTSAIRSFIMYLHNEDPIFMGCYKKWAKVDLPERLDEGLVSKEMRYAYIFGDIPGYIIPEETEKIKQLSLTIGHTLKTIVENMDAKPHEVL